MLRWSLEGLLGEPSIEQSCPRPSITWGWAETDMQREGGQGPPSGAWAGLRVMVPGLTAVVFQVWTRVGSDMG